MKKQSLLRFILDSVFLIVFNVFFFVLSGTEHSASVWISYGFIHFAYLMVLLTPILSGKSANNTILRMPVHDISTVYFFAAFVVGLTFIVIAPESVKVPLLTQIAIAGCYAVLLLIFLIANANTVESLAQQEENTLIGDAAARLKILIGKAPNARARKEIEKAYDAIHASPVKTDESVASIEQSISGELDFLTRAVNSGDAKAAIENARTITSLAEERTAYLKKCN